MNSPRQLSDQQHNDLILRVGELVAELEGVEEEGIREKIQDLLRSLDLIHREALFRLLSKLEQAAPRLLPELLQDEVVQTLLLLYEFVPEPPQPARQAGPPDGFVPLSDLQPPIWVPVGRRDEFSEGCPTPREAEQKRLLICRVGERLYAVENRCLDSILPLQMGRLEGEELVCPWHGCRYDVTTGDLAETERRLNTYPVEVGEDGMVRVGLNVR